MSEVVVGVRRIQGSSEPENPSDPAVGAVQTLFVLIDGQEVPGLVNATECETNDGVMFVTVKFIADGYRTVDYRLKEEFLKDDI